MWGLEMEMEVKKDRDIIYKQKKNLQNKTKLIL